MASPAQSAMQVSLSTIEPTWKHALKVWWSWQWRTFIAAFLLSIFTNFWINLLGGAIGLTFRGVVICQQTVAYLISAAVGLYFFKDVLDRGFKTFRVCIVPDGLAETKLANMEKQE